MSDENENLPSEHVEGEGERPEIQRPAEQPGTEQRAQPPTVPAGTGQGAQPPAAQPDAGQAAPQPAVQPVLAQGAQPAAAQLDAGQVPQPEAIVVTAGAVDRHGQMVVRVFHTTDAYVIYETADGQIQIDGDHGDFAQKAGIQLLLARFAEFRGDPVVRRKYTPKYAHAVRMAIDGNDAVAVTILEELMAEVPRHLNETRKAQLSYTLGSVVLVVFSLLLFWAAWRLDLLDPLGIRVFVALVFAAMGGGMSVAIGVKKLDLDIEESYFVNAFYGALRVAIAIVAGVVSLFLIESGFVFAFLRDSPSNSYAFALAAFLSGFSEMYVPNILKKLEDQSPTATPRTN